jgi:hypothetical protein
MENVASFLVLKRGQVKRVASRSRLSLALRIFAPWRLCMNQSFSQDIFRKGAEPQKKNRKVRHYCAAAVMAILFLLAS